MSQSTISDSDDRVVLCQQGNELSEFVDLFCELAIPVEECTEVFPDPERLAGARLVIVSGNRLVGPDTPDLSLWPRTIAVINDSGRTLVTHLSRLGVSMVIRRPIHPRALRLFLLHEIYNGPERRDRKRVLIGHPIRISSGFFRPHATLLELSPTSARIELAHAPKIGSRFRILLGKDLTQNKSVKLRAKAIRSISDSSRASLPATEIGVAILDANRHARTIQGILDRFALGPAKWTTKQRQIEIESRQTTTATKVETAHGETSHHTQPIHVPPAQSEIEPEIHDAPVDEVAMHECIPAPPSIETVANEPFFPDQLNAHSLDPADDEISDALQASPDDTSERRSDARVSYDKRVVALGEEAARILVGRDLCGGGMRVAATPSISVGDVLRVALHSGAETEPLIVLANVLRDDGEDGLVLSFDDLSEAQRERLAQIITSELSVHANDDEMEAHSSTGDAIVAAEVLETVCQRSDAEIEAHLDSVFDTREFEENAR